MKNNFTLICLFLCPLVCTVSLKAQVISQLSFYSPLISTFDMEYTNDHMVVAQNGLLIFDVSDPEKKPQLVAQKTYPGSTARAIGVQNNYAYMAFGNNGIFAVYDLSDFTAPVLKGSLAIPSTAFYVYGDMAVQGNHAYVTGFDSLYIVDVSNAANPVLANAIEAEHNDFGGAEEVVVDHQNLFLKTASGIQVYDISDPVNPLFKSSILFTHTYNTGLAIDTINHRLFQPWLTVLKEFMGYDAYDVGNASAPQFLFRDSVEFGSGDFGIAAYSYHDTTLFISKGGGINAFNVTDNAHQFVTAFSGEDIPNASVSIQVKDSVFFNARGGGLEVLKYSNTPAEEECAEPTGLKQKVIGTTAYLYWAKKPGSIGYTMRYRQLGTNNWHYVPTKDNVQKIKNLVPGSGYTWEVKSFCGLSLKESSDWSLYNIFFVKDDDLITVSPNPANSFIHVSTNNLSIAQFVITDLSGRPLIKAKSSGINNNISVASLKTGTYILQALDKTNRVITTTKIFRQ